MYVMASIAMVSDQKQLGGRKALFHDFILQLVVPYACKSG